MKVIEEVFLLTSRDPSHSPSPAELTTTRTRNYTISGLKDTFRRIFSTKLSSFLASQINFEKNARCSSRRRGGCGLSLSQDKHGVVDPTIPVTVWPSSSQAGD